MVGVPTLQKHHMAEKHKPATDHDPPAGGGSVPFFKVLAAPWLILSPSRAARDMTGGSRWAFWVSFGLGLLLLALVIVWLAMWSETVTSEWGGDGERKVHESSVAEVWRDWHGAGWIGPAELITAGVGWGLPLLAAVTAWLYLPNVHRGGSVWRSFKRSYGAVASGVGLLVVVGLAMVWHFVVMTSNVVERVVGRADPSSGAKLEFIVVAYSLGGLCLLLYWLGRATAAVAGPVVAVELPPRCEGCGYDLTHRPADDRCTECGMSITASLTAGLRRSGCDWQARQSYATWLSTSVAVVFSPTKFYQTLLLRRPDRESRWFAVWHYPAICGLAAAWFVWLVVFVAGLPPGLVLLGPAFSALAGWCVHRLVGAAMTSWAVVRGAVPDVTWAARVMAYETAFLWVFCVYNGLLLTSFFIYGDWISDHVFTPIVVGNQFGSPAEPLAVLFGNATIIAVWMRRYVVAFRCVRWSNY